MPSMEAYRRKLQSTGKTVGQAHKSYSDMVMEQTWNSDMQSRVCYIYDYFHDDTPNMNKGMTYNGTLKYKIDAKFIMTQHATLAKDQVEFHVMFRPSQKVDFEVSDELYYYQTDFVEKYDAEFPVGLYIDIPDDRGVYRRWLICQREMGLQFIKYLILPCEYRLKWVSEIGNQRILRNMWGSLRSQSSYNSGLWTDNVFTSQENQKKIWLPLNDISEELFYTYIDGSKTNQRVVISARTQKPIVWKVSKVENTDPFGIQKLTFTQDAFNPETDYIDPVTYEAYADYYSSTVEPGFSEDVVSKNACTLICNNSIIKAGGSYKLIQSKIVNSRGVDITSEYFEGVHYVDWKCYIDNIDFTENLMVTWLRQENRGNIKIKLSNDARLYLANTIQIQCIVDSEIISSISLEIAAL